MKSLETIFDELSQLPVQRPSPVIRERSGVDWDEDLFVTGPAKPSASLPQAASLPERPAADPDSLDGNSRDRGWPTLPMPARTAPPALEKKLAEQTRELTLRCAQVAELHAQHAQQAAELQLAKDEIARLAETIAPLHDELAQRDAAAVEQQKQLAVILRDNANLRDKLATAQDQTRELAEKLVTLKAAYDDRETVAASALAELDVANAKLANVADQAEALAGAVKTVELHRQSESQKLAATIQEQAGKIDTLFTDQSMQFRVRDKLAKQCEELARTIGHLESEQRQTKTELEFQAGMSEFLETVLRVERETTDEKIKQLTEALEREQAARIATDRASAAMRQEIAALLAQLTTRRLKSVEHDPSAAAA